MTCHDVQTRLSLYLYGELDFAREEEFEDHVAGCAFCQSALAREKTWHTSLNATELDVPLDLLAECRQGLRAVLADEKAERRAPRLRWRWPSMLTISPGRWSAQLALGSFLVFAGFAADRLLSRVEMLNGLPPVTGASFLGPVTRIRDIQPNPQGRVRIVFEQVRQHEIIGSPGQREIRELLLAGTRDSADPSLRLDSVDMLSGQDGTDIRDALLHSVQHDNSPAVRLKALESLRRFSDDQATRAVLKTVLAQDADPRVRAAAIDVFAPVNAKLQSSPDLEPLLRMLAHSDQDEYLRARSMQLLREMNAPSDVY